MSAIEDAQLAGFDLSLVDESLRCSFEERALQHQSALELALELEKIGQHLVTELNLAAKELRAIIEKGASTR